LVTIPARFYYTRHAKDNIVDRRLSRSWIETTILRPDIVEADPNRPGLFRAWRRVPERGGLWLRVVYVLAGDTARVITAFFDRKRKS
jgi:hypothetical protein